MFRLLDKFEDWYTKKKSILLKKICRKTGLKSLEWIGIGSICRTGTSSSTYYSAAEMLVLLLA